MNPVVSIITPNFNRADLLPETAESILKQDYPHWEWIVVDDGSTDNSIDWLRSLAENDSRIKYFQRHRNPKGAAACRNIAIEKSTGSYLIFLDSDDLLAPYCLRQRVEAISCKPNLDYVVFPSLLFKSQPDDLRLLWNIENGIPEIDRLLKGDPICQGTGTIWKKESFVKIGSWDESLALWQDVELHLRAQLENCQYELRFDLRPDVFIRISDQSLSRAGIYSYAKQDSRVRVLMNSVSEMNQKSVMQKHLSAVSELTRDLLFSSIKYRYFDLAGRLLRFSKEYRLMTKSALFGFRLFMFSEKYRLTKIPGVFIFFKNLLAFGKSTYKDSLGKVYYEGDLAI